MNRDVFADMLDRVKEEVTAPHIAKSLAYSKSQSNRAKNPRGKLDENRTISDIIAKVVRNNPGETAKKLWDQFIGQLTADGLEPRESKSVPLLVIYEGPKGPKTLKFSTFANKVSKPKASKKSH
jgi:hypothetical protein